MASKSLGVLTLDLVAKIGGFTAGLSSAERAAKKSSDQIQKEILKIGIAANAVGNTIGSYLRDGIDAVVTALPKLINEAAKFQDLSEATGAAAEDIAGLAVAAATAGVSIEDVAGATIKLTKNLATGSKETEEALNNLGISIADFKKLDPVAQYEAVSRALAGFADGAAKTANAIALFGKSGAEQLKVMKALEEQGGRTNILTKEQIQLADEFADRHAKATAELKLQAAAISTLFIPAMTAAENAVKDLIKEIANSIGGFRDGTAAQRDFAASNFILDWAEKSALALGMVAEAVVGLGKTLRAVGGSFESVAADAKVLENLTPAGALRSLATGGGGLKDALDNREKIAKEANERYKDLWTYDGKAITDSIRKSFQNQRTTIQNLQDPEVQRLLKRSKDAQGQLPQLRGITEPSTQPKAPRSRKPEIDEAQRYIDALQKQLEKTQELTAVEQALQDIQMGRLGQVTHAQKDQILALAQQIDQAKEQKKQAEEMKKYKEAVDKVNVSLLELTGHTAEAAAIKFDQENSALYTLFSDKGDTEMTKKLDQLKQITVATAQLNEQQKRFSDIQSSLSQQEERINTNAERGAIGQLDALRQLGDVRKKYYDDLKKAADAANEAAIGSGNADLIKKAEELNFQVEQLSKNLDPLADKFNNMFGEKFSDALGSVIDGTKTLKQALKDLVNSFITDLAKLAAQDVAKSFFSGGGSATGGVGFDFGSILSSLFAGGRANGGPVMPNSLYQVNERGPELFQSANGDQFLMTGTESGKVLPNPGGGTQVINFNLQGEMKKTTQMQAAGEVRRQTNKASLRGYA